MKKRNLLLILLLLWEFPLIAQPSVEKQIDAIRHNPDYVWGQGTGESIKAADDNAVRDLISQIVVNVDSRTETQVQNEVDSEGVSSSVSTSSDLRVSSNVSLANCKRLVAEHGNYVIVLRYVERAEIDKMFDARKAKIFDLIQAGEIAEQQAKVSDALRNTYWALKMISSIPEQHRTQLVTEDGRMLSTVLHERIGEILDNIAVEIERIETENDSKMAYLRITYNGQPATYCDYTYFDGYDWIGACAKNGSGLVEMPAQSSQVRIRIEYEFQKLWKSDPMVNDQLTQLPTRLPFPQYAKQASLAMAQATAPVTHATSARALAKEMEVDSLAECNKKEVRNQAAIIYPVIEAIEKRQYSEVENLFTDNG